MKLKFIYIEIKNIKYSTQMKANTDFYFFPLLFFDFMIMNSDFHKMNLPKSTQKIQLLLINMISIWLK